MKREGDDGTGRRAGPGRWPCWRLEPLRLARGTGAPAAQGGGGKGAGRGPSSSRWRWRPWRRATWSTRSRAVGSVEAFEQVQITARVAGRGGAGALHGGQAVKKGDVLAEIEPTRYSIAVRSAQAALEKAAGRRRRRRRPAPERRAAVNEQKPGPAARRAAGDATRPARAPPRRTWRGEGGAGSGAAQPARRVRARAHGRASSRRAPCRRASTCSRARCWPRCCAAIRCCCASRCPRRTWRGSSRACRRASRCARTARTYDGEDHATWPRRADAQSRMVAVTAEVTRRGRAEAAAGRLRHGDACRWSRAGAAR